MTKLFYASSLAALVVLLCPFAVNAALYDRGVGLVYDENINVTWLADANYSKTSGFDDDGLMSWQEALDWVAGLRYAGVAGWRLPMAVDSGLNGYQCLGSEMCDLFYVGLGGKEGEDIRQTGNSDLHLFYNIGSEYYWSAITHPVDTENAFDFRFAGGFQSSDNKLFPFRHAWAVHDGDVSAIPEPSSGLLTLFGIGLLATALGWRSSLAQSRRVDVMN